MCSSSWNTSEEKRARLLLGLFGALGLASPSLSPGRGQLGYSLALMSLVGLSNGLGLAGLYAGRYARGLSLLPAVDLFVVLYGGLTALLILGMQCARRGSSARLALRLCRLRAATASLPTSHKLEGLSGLGLLGLQFGLAIGLLSSGVLYYEDPTLLLASGSRNFVVSGLLLQYGLVVGVARGALARVNSALLFSLGLPAVGGSSGFEARRLRLLGLLRQMHHRLLELCRDIAAFYELTILACIAYMFVCLVVFAYFLIDLVIERKLIFSVVEYVHSFIWIVCFTTSYVALSRYVTTTGDEFNKTGIIIHQLIKSTSNNEMLKELEEFSLYLLHVHIKFTAWGFFALDGSLVQSIFSSITTYLLILVQFQLDPANKSQLHNNTLIS